MELPVQLASRFKLGEPLSDRPGSQVVAGFDTEDNNRKVAVKLFAVPEADIQTYSNEFAREASALQAGAHPNLAPILAYGSDDKYFYLVMDFIDGPTLRDELKKSTRFSVPRAIAITKALSQALEALRGSGTFHGYLDTRAVILRDGNPIIAGFFLPSIAKIRANMTSVNGLINQPAYIAPEQVSVGTLQDFRVDMYALSVMLFEMVTGERPFASGNPFTTAMIRTTQDPPSAAKRNAGVGPLLDAAILKGMARNAADRFQSYESMADALSSAAEHALPEVPPAIAVPAESARPATAEQETPTGELLAIDVPPAAELTPVMQPVMQNGPGIEKKTAPSAPSSPPEIPMTNTTIGVAFSVDKIKELLAERDKQAQPGSPQTPASAPSPVTAPIQSPSVQAVTVQGSLVQASQPKAVSAPVAHESLPPAGTVGLGGEVNQTIVGKISISDLPASIMVTSGKGRRNRFNLVLEQTMVGSSPTCQIVLEGKDVPARVALFIRRGAEYFVAPLAAAGVTVNDAELRADEERKLERGDMLRAGTVELRFIAPGEVFSLDDEKVDRVIDRPPNQVGRAVKLGCAAIAALCVLVFIIYQQGFSGSQSSAKRKATQESAKRKEVIAQLRSEGDEFLKAGKLIEPVGTNALMRFEQILEIDADDAYAKRRVTEIKERAGALREQSRKLARQSEEVEKLLADAQLRFDAGDVLAPPGANAKEIYESVLKLEPENTAAKEQLAKINQLFASMVGEVNSLLDRAKAYRAAGAFIAPPGENALEMLREILARDPRNKLAKDLLLDMAAQNIYIGDLAKKKANVQEVRKAYLTAQAIGVDPAYLAPRLRGVELMKKSSSNVIIYDGKDEKVVPATTDARFLDSAEIERRVAARKLNAEIGVEAGEQKFFELR